jgi:hypothetical protein
MPSVSTKKKKKLDISREKTTLYRRLEKKAKKDGLDIDSVPVRSMLWRITDSQEAKSKREITFLKRYITRHKLYLCGDTKYKDNLWFFNSYCCEPKDGFDYKGMCKAHPEFKATVCGKTMYFIPPGRMKDLLGVHLPGESLPDGVFQPCEATTAPHVFCFECKDSDIGESMD